MDRAARIDSAGELSALVARHTGGRAPPAVASDDDSSAGAVWQRDDDSDYDGASPVLRPLVAVGGRAMQAAAHAARANGRRADRTYDDAPGADPLEAGVANLSLDEQPLCISPETARVQQELGDGGGPDACFCCRLVRDGERVAPVCREGMRKIMDAVDACVGADPVRLSLDLADVYERHVRREANAGRREGEAECPAWPAASIYEHFFTPCHKRLDAAASLRRRVRFLEQACYDLECYGVYREARCVDGTVRRVPDAQRLRELRATYRDLDKIYGTNPTKLLFAGSNATALQHSSALPPRPMYGSLPPGRSRG